MSQPGTASASSTSSSSAPKPNLPDGNPVFRMLGLPRIRARLPSRNWLIFLSVTGSFAGALIYDRRCKTQIQRNWCQLVSPLASESIPTTQMPRKVTVYLSAPPGDGLRVMREHFTQYVQPILVAAACDWEMVEGWREGDLRAEVAERIRISRRKSGERSVDMLEEEDLVATVQRKAGVRPADGLGGDIVIGRHSWKEYMRGLHEGWLGPLSREKSEPVVKGTSLETADSNAEDVRASKELEHVTSEAIQESGTIPTPSSDMDHGADGKPESDQVTKPSVEAKTEETPKKKARLPTPPYILPLEYSDHAAAPTMPTSLAPVEALPFPHILGFLNTPIRLQRFLTRRYLADAIGAQVASIILATETRHWNSDDSLASSGGDEFSAPQAGPTEIQQHWEQHDILRDEEAEWHETAREPNKADEATLERPLLEPMVIDERIGARMTRFAMSEDAMRRARDAEALVMVRQAATGATPTYVTWWRVVQSFCGFDIAESRGLGWKDGLVGGEDD